MENLEVTQLEVKRYHTKAKYLKFSTVPYKEKTMAADLLVQGLGLLVYGVKPQLDYEQVYRGDGKEYGSYAEGCRNEEGGGLVECGRYPAPKTD